MRVSMYAPMYIHTVVLTHITQQKSVKSVLKPPKHLQGNVLFCKLVVLKLSKTLKISRIMNIKNILLMRSSLTARILRYLAITQLAVSIILVVVSFFMWAFIDPWDRPAATVAPFLLVGVGIAFNAFIFNGFAVLVEAASIYIQKNKNTEEEE